MVSARLVALKLVLDELGIPSMPKGAADPQRVQLGIYLAQVTGIDLGYRFSWESGQFFDPSLAADYTELTRINGRIAEKIEGKELIPAIRSRLKLVREHLLVVPSQLEDKLEPPDWWRLIATYHYLTTRLGLRPEYVEQRVYDLKVADAYQWKAVEPELDRIFRHLREQEATLARS